ncbi:MAG TPA: aldo/keto reductase [Geobacteraceae bacterium]|nr:aldo/keto reductase [Geobacteraceae bacterium]
MDKVILGKTGMRINRLVFGTLPLGPLQAGLSPEEGGRLIRHALEAGVNLLDTAELYGTYPHIRRALEGYTGEVFIASKSHAADGQTARSHVERALRELSMDRLDIVHVHGARIRDPFAERAEVLEELIKMRKEGKIAHIGLSGHYISAMRAAAGSDDIAVIHPLINRTGMGIQDGSAEEMAEAIAACSISGKGVYAMKALAGGNLISEARESLRHVLGLPGVDAVAVGMLSTREIDANIALFNGLAENEAEWQTLEKRRRKLRIMEQFCKGCGHCITACPSGALSLVDGTARVDDEACVLCGYCAAACPEFMIRVI